MIVSSNFVHRVDIDYESYLFDPSYTEKEEKYLKLIKEYEYIYFLINTENNSILKNHKIYHQDYLDYLKDLQFKIPILQPDALVSYGWWGNHHNKQLEQMLNSKITSASLAMANNWGFEKGAIVETLMELKNHVELFPTIELWIIKNPTGFSGTGNKQFRSSQLNIKYYIDILHGILSIGKALIEPYHDRIFDIGTTYEIKNGIITNYFMIENFISKSDGFIGGCGCSTINKFKDYIKQKYNYNLDDLLNITKHIVNYYISLGARDNIQIDSFIYKSDTNNDLLLYPLVEVNYRKTMGLVINHLVNKSDPNSNYLEWRIENIKHKKNNMNSYSPCDGWIRLSPDDNIFQSYFKVF